MTAQPGLESITMEQLTQEVTDAEVLELIGKFVQNLEHSSPIESPALELTPAAITRQLERTRQIQG